MTCGFIDTKQLGCGYFSLDLAYFPFFMNHVWTVLCFNRQDFVFSGQSKQRRSILTSSRSCSLRIYTERKKDVENIVLFFKKRFI